MNIVILSSHPTDLNGDVSWDGLKAFGSVTKYDYSFRVAEDEALEKLKDADAAIIHQGNVKKSLMEKLPRLKFICITSTGYDEIDVATKAYAKEHDIVISNVAGYGAASVSQHAFALLLEIANKVGAQSDLVKQGGWKQFENMGPGGSVAMMELEGKTFGIVGYGAIGKRSGAIASAFGMKVIAYDYFGKPGDGVYRDLDTVLKESDVISFHCPLNEGTREIISKKNIDKMKDGVILINTARGGLMNENDIASALESGKIRAFGSDVMPEEPPRKDNPLRSMKNCFITPHSAWLAPETRQKIVDVMVANFASYAAGKPISVIS